MRPWYPGARINQFTTDNADENDGSLPGPSFLAHPQKHLLNVALG